MKPPQGAAPGDSVDSIRYSRIAEDLLHRLFPICRSITGEGIRRTLRIIQEYVPLQFATIPSGAEIFDWQVPLEWNIRDAYVKNSEGERVIDFRKSNLHVVSYSAPVRRRMTFGELSQHLHSLPSQPDAIPYLTSYFEEDWGFCLTHRQLTEMVDDEYEVCIDSRFDQGGIELGECVLSGETDQEILFSTYCCHPSMANNELSGPIALALLYDYLSSLPTRRHTFRFYFGPETIGALAFLHLRGNHLIRKLTAGLVVTCCGDRGGFTYKKVRRPDNALDKAVLHALKHSQTPHTIVPFTPTGSDERQYCSPGFNLPVGSLMRSMYRTYPEYHTSLDNLDYVSASSLVETVRVCANIVHVLENNLAYENLRPFGEPHLSKYGLHATLGGQKDQDLRSRRIRHLLNYSDSKHDLVDIAEMLDLPLWQMEDDVKALRRVGLLGPDRSTHPRCEPVARIG